MNNIVLVNLESAYTSVYGIWQWDYGQILRIQSKKKLPKAVEVHFSLQEKGGESVTRIGTTADGVTDVPIPDSFLENNGKISVLISCLSGRQEILLSLSMAGIAVIFYGSQPLTARFIYNKIILQIRKRRFL